MCALLLKSIWVEINLCMKFWKGNYLSSIPSRKTIEEKNNFLERTPT